MVAKRRVLITGAAGMLGSALISRFNNEYTVRGLDLKGDDNILPLDITDRKKLLQEVSRINPELVIHAAAYTDVDGCELNPQAADRVNRGGTENIAQACKEMGAFLVYISTDFVFDGEKPTPYIEDDIPNPINIYGKSKLEGEEAVKKTLEKFVIIRTSWLFGEGGKNFVDVILKKAVKQKELKVVADQIGSPTYAADLATAIIKLTGCIIDRPSSAVYHITNGGKTFWNRYAEEILRDADITDVKVIPVTSEELNRPAKRPRMSLLDTNLYQKTTGTKMRDYREALKEYISERREP